MSGSSAAGRFRDAGWSAEEFDGRVSQSLKTRGRRAPLGTTLVNQRAHRHIPPSFKLPGYSNRHANVAKRQLVIRTPVILRRGDFDAGRFISTRRTVSPLCLAGARVGAHDEVAPVANPAVKHGPDFLPLTM